VDYDESAIAGIYDEARALTPERLRQWRDVLAMDIDCSRISAIVDLVAPGASLSCWQHTSRRG